MKKVAVILSGSGYLDGSEIHEATLTLLALDRRHAQVQCFAPDIDQAQVINHATGEPSTGTRSVLAEAARIARGAIKPLSLAHVDDFDAVIIPGGYGAVRNLCNFATHGHDMTINQDVAIFTRSLHREGKPVGLICIAPVMAPAIGGPGTRCTIGDDTATATAIETMGGVHVPCAVTECVIDKERKIVSTPAYMLAERITDAEAGINKLVDAVLDMA